MAGKGFGILKIHEDVMFKKAVHDHFIFGAFLGNSALGVEIFLVLSGVLAARSWMRHPEMPFGVSELMIFLPGNFIQSQE